MRVRMLVQLSGPTMALEPGDERDFPQAEAIRLVNAGFAAPVVEPQLERAVSEPVAETRFTSVLKLPDQAVEQRKGKKGRR